MANNRSRKNGRYRKHSAASVLLVLIPALVLTVAAGMVGFLLFRIFGNPTPGNRSDINAAAASSETVARDSGLSAATPAPTASPSPTPEPTPTPEPDQKDYTAEDAEFTMNNGLLLVYQDEHWKAVNLFGGGRGENYAEALNTLHEKLGSSVTIYSMPAPLNSQFYTPRNAAEYTSDQEESFAAVKSQLDPAIVTVDLCPVFRKHTEEPIYLRTDPHWSQLGAYYAVRAFAQAAEVDFDDLSSYTAKVNEDYMGSMSVYVDDDRLLSDPEDFPYYLPTNDYSVYYYDQYFNYSYEDSLFWDVDTPSSYLMYMGGDGHIVKIKSPAVHNGRKLLVIKDSYGNAEAPFLTNSFEEVIIADMRYLGCNLVSVVQDLGVTDVLFTMCSYSVTGENADNLFTLIYQNEGETVYDEEPYYTAARQEEAAAWEDEEEDYDG